MQTNNSDSICDVDEIQIVIDKFNELYGEKYSDPSYVYSFSNYENAIYVLQKLPHTMTDEDSIEVVDSDYASYYADKVLIVAIYHPVNLNQDELTCQEVFNHGIRYVKKFARALYDFLENHNFKGLNGIHKTFYNNGGLEMCGKIINGKKYGVWKAYSNTGSLFAESTYYNGNVITFTTYYTNTTTVHTKTYLDLPNEKKLEIINFPNGKRERIRITYNNSKLCPIDIKWHSDGNLRSIFMKYDRDTSGKNQNSYSIKWDKDGSKNVLKKIVPAN